MAPRASRTRALGPAPRAPSKLSDVRSARITFPAAVAAGVLLIALIGVVILATGGRGQRLAAAGHAAVATHLASLGFAVQVIHLQGASRPAQAEILQAVGVKFGTPILPLDLRQVRARVEKVGWVARARVVRLLPDTLVVAIDQRPLLAVWEHAGQAVVIAANGRPVSSVDPGHFSALPLIVGEGANDDAATIVPLVLSRPRLATRLDALMRVDARRWDVRLKDGTLIMLPADDPAAALAQLDGLDRASRILDLGLARVDLRDLRMIVVRPRGGAAPVLTSGGA
jgi:cell division protein FtsQ